MSKTNFNLTLSLKVKLFLDIILVLLIRYESYRIRTCSGSDFVYFEEDVVLALQYKSAVLESQKLGSNGSCQLHFVQSHPQPSHLPDDRVAEILF